MPTIGAGHWTKLIISGGHEHVDGHDTTHVSGTRGSAGVRNPGSSTGTGWPFSCRFNRITRCGVYQQNWKGKKNCDGAVELDRFGHLSGPEQTHKARWYSENLATIIPYPNTPFHISPLADLDKTASYHVPHSAGQVKFKSRRVRFSIVNVVVVRLTLCGISGSIINCAEMRCDDIDQRPENVSLVPPSCAQPISFKC